MDTDALVVDAFAQLGICAELFLGVPDQGFDLVLEPDGVAVQVQITRRSLVTDDVARRLLAPPGDGSGSVVFVVGDRVTETARKLLTEKRGGYFDLRGRLAVRADQMVVDAEVERVGGRAERTQALSGKAGLEVAAALFMEPARGFAVRELARELGRSVSTVSEVLAALRRDGLIDGTNIITGPRLFWQVADRWPSRRTYLAAVPRPGDSSAVIKPLRLGLEDVEGQVGWALTDSAAAVAYGAPLAVGSGQVLDFYVPDVAMLRRATTLLGIAESTSQARCAVRVATTRAVCSRRVDLGNRHVEWPLAHPVFVALDLAQDAGRGREILDDWTPEGRWARVW